MNDMKIYEEIIKLQQAGIPSALATVVESVGSSPRKAGAKMLVRGDGSILGTIGGGKIELETIEAGRAAIGNGEPRTVRFSLTEEHGHVCGGKLLIYIEPVALPSTLIIIGAGHVGRALTTAAGLAGFRVVVIDDRPGFAVQEQLPDAAEVHLGESTELLGKLKVNPGAFIVITTTGFEKDFAAARAALATPARFIGVIGSNRKRDVLVQTLNEEGFSRDDIGRLNIPVGLSIGAETPAEIAVSIVAQLVGERRGHGAKRSGDSPGSWPVTADGNLQAASPAP